MSRFGWPNVDGVETAAVDETYSEAECDGCDWHRDGEHSATWLPVRAAARRHVASTGHSVQVVAGRVYTYRRQAIASPAARP